MNTKEEQDSRDRLIEPCKLDTLGMWHFIPKQTASVRLLAKVMSDLKTNFGLANPLVSGIDGVQAASERKMYLVRVRERVEANGKDPRVCQD